MINEKLFKNPPHHYSIAPFWFWNDDLKVESLEWQMNEMLEKGVYEFFIHARKGLSVPYLSEEWFDKVSFVLEKAEKLGMKVWIYDEENWPSGYAGGLVLKNNPDYCGKNLRMLKTSLGECKQLKKTFNTKEQKLVCILMQQDNAYANITTSFDTVSASAKYDEQTPILLFVQEYTYWHPAYSQDYYLDMMRYEATQAFIDCTHKAYQARFGKYFGNVISGFFTDEAGFYNNLTTFKNCKDACTIAWTDDFPDFFQHLNGYAIIEYLPYLWSDMEGISTKVKRDFYETACEMYKTNFLEPQRKFCEEKGMKFVGHLHMEDFMHLQIITQGNMVRAMDSLSYAGTDRIDLNSEKINEKFISSVGHIHGKERVLSETYALSGWGLTLQEMKRWADWQYVRGVNMLVPHAFYASIDGDRKWECPPSQFYQNPYWQYYNLFSDYIRRLSYVLSNGIHVAPIAVYYPMTTAYEQLTPCDNDKVIALDKFIQNLSFALLGNQYDFDFIDDTALTSAAIGNGHISIKQEQYSLLIIPAAKNLTLTVLQKIKQFVMAKGAVIFLKTIPEKCVDPYNQSAYSSLLSRLLESEHVYYLNDATLCKRYTYSFNFSSVETIVAKYVKKDVVLEHADINIKYLHRKDSDKDVYFVINEDGYAKDCVVGFLNNNVPQIWVIKTGDIEDTGTYWKEGEYTYVRLSFPKYGSYLIAFTSEPNMSLKKKVFETNDIPAPYYIQGMWDICINNTTHHSPLTPWSTMGLPYYSGEAIYEKEFDIPANYLDFLCLLDLGKVCDCAQVWLNEKPLGYEIWEPYRFDITIALKAGKNTLKIKVVNTLANELEKSNQKSGLLGPVKIQFFQLE